MATCNLGFALRGETGTYNATRRANAPGTLHKRHLCQVQRFTRQFSIGVGKFGAASQDLFYPKVNIPQRGQCQQNSARFLARDDRPCTTTNISSKAGVSNEHSARKHKRRASKWNLRTGGPQHSE